MALLLGRHICKIDKKGRVSVPKPFRAPFQDRDFRGVYVFPLFKYAALLACGEDQMTRFLGDLDALEMFSDDHDDLAAVIMNNTEPLAFDPEGRIVLTPAFLGHTGITAQALFVGRGSRFEIWDPAAFDAHNAAAFERARARGVTLPRRDGGEAPS
jgi:MraZ protein